MVNRIACFLTCGYTEAGAMQYFLRKINSNYEYKQYLPNKPIKKKGMPKSLSPSLSGLTGEPLLEKIYSIIQNHKDEIKLCKAIVIEDDLDGRFYNWHDNDIHNHQQRIRDNILSIIGSELPVFILYASPEIESWFIADWENGFKYIYSDSEIIPDVETKARAFFVYHLKQYINDNILKEYIDDIENYGYFDETYYKLSDQLINAIQYNIKEYMQRLPNSNINYIQQISTSRHLYYSKKLHGDLMLRKIEPSTVASVCRRFFGSAFYQLSSF